MSRPARIPEKGDVSAPLVAQRLGISVADFELKWPELTQRGFPDPDPTTGLWAIEAVDKWRLRRYPMLFPELVSVLPTAIDAGAVFEERIRKLG